MGMGFHEDDRIRRKNREFNPPTSPVPILYPVGGSYDEKKTVGSSDVPVDSDDAKTGRGKDADDRSDRYWHR